ncbi:hypothetical protein [Streptomyces sp. NPDC059491]|uniref:hypothetical protein n=1 Tax=Streptomyces sp. NPDC059491 TaxID=3346850 RepID=UPI0036C48589
MRHPTPQTYSSDLRRYRPPRKIRHPADHPVDAQTPTMWERGVDHSVASGPAPEPDEWMRRLGELPLPYEPGVRGQYDLGDEVVGCC